VLREAQKRYGVHTIGYEINPVAYLKARLFSFGLHKIKIRRENFWEADLAGADVVFCYLYPDVMIKLAAKLTTDLKPGTVVAARIRSQQGLTTGKQRVQ
jgi:hypothetical protein